MLIKNSALSFACTAKSTLNIAPLTLSTPKHLAEISRFFLILKIFFSPLLTSFYTHTNRLFFCYKIGTNARKTILWRAYVYHIMNILMIISSTNCSIIPPFFCSFNYIFFLGIKKPRQEFFQPWLKRLFV